MTQELLTLKEIARRLEAPESNIRYYRDRFDDFLPSVGEGRKRRYLPEALDIFRFIVEQYKEDRSTEEVGQELMQRFPRQARLDQGHWDQSVQGRSQAEFQGETAFELIHRQARTMERLSELLFKHNDSDRDLKRLREEQTKLKKAFVLFWKRQRRDGNPLPGISGGVSASLEEELGSIRSELKRLEREKRDMEERFKASLDRLKEQMDMCYAMIEKHSAQLDQEP